MLLTLSLIILTLWVIKRFFLPGKPRGDLDRMPGPSFSVIIKQLFNSRVRTDEVRREKHVRFTELAKKYGSVYHVATPTMDMIMISDYDSMHKVLIGSAKEFSGRAQYFRMQTLAQGTGILLSHPADATWKALRKASQRHLKQFGDGLSRLESIITDIAEDMFTEFGLKKAEPFDPKPIIFDTALNSIAFLISGVQTRSGDPIIEKMREYEYLFNACLAITSAPLALQILDILPCLRFFNGSGWKMMQRHQQLEREVWQMVNDMNDSNPDAHSLCRVLKASVKSKSDAADGLFTDIDARKTSLQLLFAGVTTTSNTFYGGINLLAHDPGVQSKLFAELEDITGGARSVVLTDRPKMHYARATVLEFLRYTSVVPLGVPHSTTVETELTGYVIPAGVTIVTNLYALHHDEAVWGDPFVFRPERFLDEAGELVPADHPHRKNLMPFGAGMRVCLGESLALTRLFLWTTSLVQRFTIEPAEGNTKETTDPRLFAMEGVLMPTPYKVILRKR